MLCAFGACLALAWGTLAVIFSLAERRAHALRVVRFLCDFLLMAAAGAGICIFSYYFNRGEVRFFALLGLFCSFCLTRKIFSLLLAPLLEVAICAFLRAAWRIICIILTPFAKIFKYLVNKLQKIIRFIRKTLAKIGNLVYNICVRKYILKKSHRGFLKWR